MVGSVTPFWQASGSGMDVASGSKSNATAWRESPAASGRTNKRKGENEGRANVTELILTYRLLV
jgi:hypothetical protein